MGTVFSRESYYWPIKLFFQLSFAHQLGEAILTERIPQSGSAAIRLVDSPAPRPRTREDPEREFLVTGADSDEENENDGDEGAKRQGKLGIFTHTGARVSRNDLGTLFDPQPPPKKLIPTLKFEQRSQSRGSSKSI